MRVPRLSETEILIASAISGKELYGLQIVDEVLALTRGKRRISLGGLYTTLHRMESKKLVTSRIKHDHRSREDMVIAVLASRHRARVFSSLGRRSTIVGVPPSAVPNFTKSLTVVARRGFSDAA